MARIEEVVFLGSKAIGLKCLKEMCALDRNSLTAVITLNDSDDSRSCYGEFVQFCKDIGVRLFTVVNRREYEILIGELGPELCIVVGWYWLIRKEILESVPHGFIGIHNSLLPRYRGGSPLVWAILNGESETGASLFSIEEGMDTGAVWGQKTIEIGNDDFIADVLKKAEDAAVALVREKYLAILNKKIASTSQPRDGATYCAQRFPEDGVIDWAKSSAEVYNFIRAQSKPYPGAFTYLDGRKLTVWKASPRDMTYYGSDGQIARLAPDGIYVICGDNRPLVLETVQLENEDERSACDIIKSIRIRLTGK